MGSWLNGIVYANVKLIVTVKLLQIYFINDRFILQECVNVKIEDRHIV